jgi:hypothetical protein
MESGCFQPQDHFTWFDFGMERNARSVSSGWKQVEESSCSLVGELAIRSVVVEIFPWKYVVSASGAPMLRHPLIHFASIAVFVGQTFLSVPSM